MKQKVINRIQGQTIFLKIVTVVKTHGEVNGSNLFLSSSSEEANYNYDISRNEQKIIIYWIISTKGGT